MLERKTEVLVSMLDNVLFITPRLIAFTTIVVAAITICSVI